MVPRTARKIAQRVISRIMPQLNVRDWDFAVHLRSLFRQFDIDCVLDVGANVGQYRDFLRNKVRYGGPIVSFEPVARHVEILRGRAGRDKGWRIENYALGAECRQMSINVAKADEFSSFLEPENSKVPEFSHLNDTDHVESVEVRRLDDIFPALQERIGFRHPYLKLDTQGYDLEVLRGSVHTLRSIAGLQTEASVIGIYRQMPDFMETIAQLKAYGFDLTGMYAVARDASLRLVEFDCVTINREYARKLPERPA